MKDEISVKYFFVFLLILITVSAAAQENIMFNFNSGYFSVAGNIPTNDNFNRETAVSVPSFGIEFSRINIGFEFAPAKFFYWKKSAEDKNITAYSLVNFNLYWNALSLGSSFINFYIGPFASINYLFIEDGGNWNRYIFTTGLQTGLRGIIGKVYYNLVSFGLGYRNIDGRSKYYIGVNIDLALFFVSVIYLVLESAASKDEK